MFKSNKIFLKLLVTKLPLNVNLVLSRRPRSTDLLSLHRPRPRPRPPAVGHLNNKLTK